MAGFIYGVFTTGLFVGMDEKYVIDLFVPDTMQVDSILDIKEFDKHCVVGFNLQLAFPVSSINVDSATCTYTPVSAVKRNGEKKIYDFIENAREYKASYFFTQDQFDAIVKDAFSKFTFKPIGINGADFCLEQYNEAILDMMADKMLLL